MNNVSHWTHQSTTDYVYSISSSFVSQLEARMEEKEISKSALAERLNRSPGRISQVYTNPGNLSLRVIVEHARALGMKVGIIAYDDGDPENHDGPINPNVFVKSWEALDYPRDLFDVADASIHLRTLNEQGSFGNQYVVKGTSDVFSLIPEPISMRWEIQKDYIFAAREIPAPQRAVNPEPRLTWTQELQERKAS